MISTPSVWGKLFMYAYGTLAQVDYLNERYVVQISHAWYNIFR